MISAFRKYVNTIKGRLVISHLGIAFLMTPVLIYSYTSARKLSNAREIREKLTHFNINRLKSSEHFALMLDYDIKTDSFHLGLETANYKRYQEYLTRTRNILDGLRSDGDSFNNEVFNRRLVRTSEYLNQVDNYIREVIELKKTKGFKDYGYVGDMRDHVHRLERRDDSVLLAHEILSLRRREKDFFLRNDPKYVRLLNQESEILLNRLKPDTLFLSTRQELLAYRVLFNEVVRIDEQIGNSNSGLIRDISDASMALEKEYASLFGLINTHARLLSERIRVYLTIFFVLTLITASVLAYYISGKISRPIQALVGNMGQQRNSEFDTGQNEQIVTGLKELNILSSAYQDLIDQLREQFGNLQTKNAQLNELNDQLKKSEKELKEASEVKDKFFSIISHDLRGHSGNIGSLSAILANEEQEISPEQKTLMIRHIRDTSQNLNMLLENLLNWARSQMSNHQVVKKSFDLIEVIDKSLNLYRETADQKGIFFEFNTREVPNVYADKDMVDFAIRNLISNSIKFSRKGDRISVELMSIQESVQIKITDTGIGMTPEQVRALENRQGESISRSGTGKEKGTGLGFATAQDFIRKNGGRINVYSEVNKGSTFVFTIPTSLTRESILNIK